MTHATGWKHNQAKLKRLERKLRNKLILFYALILGLVGIAIAISGQAEIYAY